MRNASSLFSLPDTRLYEFLQLAFLYHVGTHVVVGQISVRIEILVVIMEDRQHTYCQM